MALKIGTILKNAIVNQVILSLAGTTGVAGTAKVYLYTGTQPTDADTAPTGTSATLLGTISDISWALCTGGTSALTGVFTGSAGVAGTVGWARFESIMDAGTFVMDGNVGTGATNVLVINSPSFTTAGAPVAILTGPLYIS